MGRLSRGTISNMSREGDYYNDHDLTDPAWSSPAPPTAPCCRAESHLPLQMNSPYPLTPIMACGSRHEAELAVSFFAAYDVAVHVQADDGGAQQPNLTFLNEVILYVRESDLATAEELLDLVEAEHSLVEKEDGEVDELRQELWKAVRGVIAGLLYVPLFLQPLALLKAVRLMRRIRTCPQATRRMRNQIRGVVIVSALLNLLLFSRVATIILYFAGGR